MMIDHYSVLEASDSERESNEIPGVPRKLQKRKRPKVLLSTSKEDPLHSSMVGSTDGCLSLLERGFGRPLHAVGKRTPRFPVSYLRKKEDGENYVSPKKKRRKSEINANEHSAVLALTEALQRVDSPQMSQTPRRRTENMKSSPVQSWDRMSESSPANLRDAFINENWSESGIGCGGADLACVRDASSLAELEGIGTVEVHKKGKFYGNKIRVEKNGNSQSDDGGEACSGTEEEQKFSTLKGKVEIEMPNAKIDETSHWGQRKRSKKFFSDDEPADLIGLQTLALVSAMEFESSSLFDDERTTQTGNEKSSVPESASTSHHRDKIKLSRQKEKATSGVEGTTSRKPKRQRYPLSSAKSVSEANKQPQPISSDMLKRKHEAVVAKVLDEEENTSVIKGKRSAQISSPSKQLKSSKLPDGSFSADQKTIANDLATSTEQVPVASQVILSTRKTSRRKMDLKRAMIPKVNVLKNQTSKYTISLQDGATHLKDKLSCILSSPMVRRWCAFEWFYSAVDYPWFARREFVEYLNHVGLGHIPRLTRVEWGVIRSSLGKPRRFSERFLHEEREKLQQYRESVRKHYMELRTGLREGLPTDLARPLSVGQRVIAIHPKTRELHDGSVLTVDHDRCRVQFDSAELGVEFVKDIDCMPSNPLDNMPEALRRQKISVLPKELLVNGKPHIGEFTAIEKLRNAQNPMNALMKQVQVEANHANLLAKATSTDIVNAQGAFSHPSRVSHIELKEYDIRALSELNHALDKKASSALLNLRQLNTYPGNNVRAWLKPPANSCFSGMLRSHDSSCVSQDSGSVVLEIVRGSRLKAHTMVDAAVQAISSMKEGEDAFARIGEALDSVDRSHSVSESRTQMIRSQEAANTGLCLQNQLIPSTPEPQVNSSVSGPQSNDSEKIETAIPSELISSCVAALLMIQTCTERQYPPADVAQIIDSAVTSLHPCCPQNLPIYREIQMCMGRIKTQILALIPT